MRTIKFYQKCTILLLALLIGAYLTVVNQAVFETTKSIEEDYPVWIEMMEEPGVSMKEARKAFDEYWKYHTHHKGDKSKKFERWYTINSKRLDQYGNVIPAIQVRSEFQKMRINAAVAQTGGWSNYGPINVGPKLTGDKRNGGRVKDISFHPTDANTYYVSCFKSGLFKTTDDGTSWTPLTDHLTEEVYISKILPSNPNTIYIGTNLGVLKSTDGGVNWNATGLSSGNTNALLIKTDNENIIIAGNSTGIYKSTDAGVNFTLVQAATNTEELRIHPTDPAIMYAGTDGTTSQFFRSTDGGDTWIEDTNSFGQGAFMKIAVTPAQPNYVYVVNSRDHQGDDSFEGVYRSTDSGATFTKQSGTTPCITGYKDDGSISRGQPNYNLFITVDPADANIVYAGGVKSWKSTNGGVNWTQVFNNVTTDGFGLHLDQLTWAYSPVNNRLFALNDGGVFYLNASDKFENITDGLPIAEVFECTQSQTNPTNVAGGTMHCGIKVNKNGVWYSPWGGDEATCLYDYSDDNYMYHFKYEKIHRSTDGGLTFQRINPTTTDRGEYVGTGALDKSDVNTLFAGLFEVERINNARTATSSQAWDKISSFGGTTKIKKIEQSEADHNIMYVSRGTAGFYRSDNVRDVSPSFTNLSSNLPNGSIITDIATHHTNVNIVYILQGNLIYKSSDKGASWTDISSGLPNVALLEMVYDKSSDEGIYVGTDFGVFYKDATLTNWIDYSADLVAKRVSGMDIYYGATRDESFITVSTDGRGFWRSQLNDVVAQAPVADFSSNYTSAIIGSAILFTDTSTNSPTTHEWTFEGGTPATSLDVNPSVAYTSVGTYSVTLKVTNNAGNNTKIKNGYITVTADGGTLQSSHMLDGNFIDASLYHRDASNTGVTFISDGTRGTVADFDGTDKLTLPGYSGELGTGARTITAWVKTGTANKSIMAWGVASTSTKWVFKLESTGVLRVEPGGGNIIGSTNVADSQWHHVACTVEDDGTPNVSDIKLYVDGQLETTTPTAVAINTTDGGDVVIGSDQLSRMFVGQMSDVRLYSEALTLQQINDIMNEVPSAVPVSDFTSDVTTVTEGGTVNYTDTSTNTPTSWSWTFTGGTPATSTAQNPIVTYATAGTYQVALTATNTSGSDTKTVVNYVTVTAAPIADFTSDVTVVSEGGTVNFTDTSTNTPTSWSWTFTGGTPATSTAQNPIVTYATAGTYQVALTATNSSGSDTKTVVNYVTVTAAPIADFTSDVTVVSEGGTVNFTDTSTNTPTSWSWTFDGGTPATSTAQNPTVTYDTAGTYQVALTATNSSGSDTKTVIDYITVNVPPGSGLEALYLLDTDASDSSGNGHNGTNSGVAFITDGARGQVADFNGTAEIVANGYAGIQGGNDRSITAWIKTTTTNDAIVSWGTTANTTKWIFMVDGSGKIRIEIASGYIVGTTIVNDGLWHHVACTFANDGTPTIDELIIYTDGQPDTISTSTTTVLNTGNGTVKIGTDHASRRFLGQMDQVHIIDVALSATDVLNDYNLSVPGPVADFTSNVTSVVEGGTVNFTDISTNTPTSWTWTFDGGTPATSTAQNPVVTYATAGTYQVALTATNSGGSDTNTVMNYITVTTAPACSDIISDGFESGFGNWNDGGNDVARIASNANTGSYSIRIRDNSSASSSMFSDVLDLSSLSEVSINFSYYPVSMESGEDFMLEISTNGGSSYSNVQTWVSGTDFNNKTRYNEFVVISGPFTSSTVFRLRCDASGNNDQIFIDDVVISECISAPRLKQESKEQKTTELLVETKSINVYPNPMTNVLNISFSSIPENSENVWVSINSLTGQQLFLGTYSVFNGKIEIDTSNLVSGIYVVSIRIDGEIVNKKIIKK